MSDETNTPHDPVCVCGSNVVAQRGELAKSDGGRVAPVSLIGDGHEGTSAIRPCANYPSLDEEHAQSWYLGKA